MTVLKNHELKLIRLADKIATLSNKIDELSSERKMIVDLFRNERSKQCLRLVK